MAADYEFDPAKVISYDDLQRFTDNFCENNLIGSTQFGKLYRGKIPQGWRGLEQEKEVTVKIQQTESEALNHEGKHCRTYPEDFLEGIKGEINFLSLPFLMGHQIVPKLEGYCFEMGRSGIVYDVKPFNTLYKLMSNRVQFGWRSRVKLALALARFLHLCHSHQPQYLVRNLSAEHILLDHDLNPLIVDFTMICLGKDESDGVEVPRWADFQGSNGYTDPNVYVFIGHWYSCADRFSFGVILLELILKFTSLEFSQSIKAKNHKPIYELALGMYEMIKKKKEKEKEKEKESPQAKRQKVESSIVSNSSPAILDSNEEVKFLLVNIELQDDPDFDKEDGIQLSMLALSCVGNNMILKKPANSQFMVSQIEKLQLVTKYGGML